MEFICLDYINLFQVWINLLLVASPTRLDMAWPFQTLFLFDGLSDSHTYLFKLWRLPFKMKKIVFQNWKRLYVIPIHNEFDGWLSDEYKILSSAPPSTPLG